MKRNKRADITARVTLIMQRMKVESYKADYKLCIVPLEKDLLHLLNNIKTSQKYEPRGEKEVTYSTNKKAIL